MLPASLLLLAFVVGFLPLARWVLPGRRGGTDAPAPVPARYAYPALLGGLVVAVAGAGLVPANLLPLAVGGYAAGLFVLIGLSLVGGWAVHLRRSSPTRPWHGPDARWRHRPTKLSRRPDAHQVGAAVVLLVYAVVAVAVPMHLGLTHAVPVADRWWLLPIIAACVGLLLVGAELVATGVWWRQPLVLAATTVALMVAVGVGLAPGFIGLVLPLLVVLFVGQAGWSLVLRHQNAPAWLAAAVGAVVVAWPITTTLPLTAG